MFCRSVGLAVALALSTPSIAEAYCRASTCRVEGTVCDPPEPSDCGKPLLWRRPCIGFATQESGSTHIDRAVVRSIARQAFDTWERAQCADGTPSIHVEDLKYVECNAVEFNEADGNANVILFRDDSWHKNGSHDIALTTVNYDPDTGELFDADIELNTFTYTFTTTDATSDYDLLSVLTHEAGHFLGLAHSPDADATMFFTYPRGSIENRSLHPDDVAAICATYPPRERSSACNPIPRHGFSPSCRVDQKEGTCSASPLDAAPAIPDGPSARWLMTSVAALCFTIRFGRRGRRESPTSKARLRDRGRNPETPSN